MKLCQYKNSLGIPGKGFHKHYFFGFAVMDLLGTIGIAYLIGKYFKLSVYKVFIVLMILAIFLHWLFCVDTVLNKILFG